MAKYIEKCYNIIIIILMFYKQYLFQTQEIHPWTIPFLKKYSRAFMPLSVPPAPNLLYLSVYIIQTWKDTEMYQEKHLDTRDFSTKQIIKYLKYSLPWKNLLHFAAIYFDH